jgi:thiamine biosynthesis protein ThiS
MQLLVNGEERQFDAVRTVADLVARLGLSRAAVAVEVNRRVVPRREHEQLLLADGDAVEIVTLVGGG